MLLCRHHLRGCLTVFEVLFFTIKAMLNLVTYKEWLCFCNSYLPREKKEGIALKLFSRFENELTTSEKCNKAISYFGDLPKIRKIIIEEHMINLAKDFESWNAIFYKAQDLNLKPIIDIALDNMVKYANSLDEWVTIYLISGNVPTKDLAMLKIKGLVNSFDEWHNLFKREKRELKIFSFDQMYCLAKTFDEWFIIYKISSNYSSKEKENSVALSKINELAEFKDLLKLIGYSSNNSELEEIIINKILISEFTQDQIVSLYEKSSKDSKIEKLLLNTKLCCRRK